MLGLLATPIDELTLEALREAFAGAGDEDDRWEAKGGNVRSEHVSSAVAALANHRGGLLILGASRGADRRWSVEGCRFSSEPGQWVGQVIREHVRPAPPRQIKVFELDDERRVVVVMVERHPQHLVVTSDGRVLRREHGSNQPLADGGELTRHVRSRSGAGPAAALDLDASPDDVGDGALALVAAGREAQLRSSVVGLQSRIARAAQFETRAALDGQLDRLSAIAGTLAQADPASEVARLALQAHHRVFEAGTAFAIVPGGRPDLELFRGLLRNTRALGGLLVRLGLWSSVRTLVAHEVGEHPDIYPGWLTYVEVQEARALGRPINAEHLREPVRNACETALRLPALRPDGADEHQVLDSVLIFDLLANVIELDQSDRRGGPMEISPSFAVFGAQPHRPVVAQILRDDAMRDELLPARRQRDAARLLACADDQARRCATAFASFWEGIASGQAQQTMRGLAGAPGA
ncbi:MAG: helix-turn-helix domain-containing protein [Solirubrobacteraceae bacterium]